MTDLSNPEKKPVGMIDRIKNKSTVLYEEHKTACTVGVIVATNILTFVAVKRFAPTIITIAPVFNNNNIGNSTVINNGGRLVKYVKNLDTGVITKGIGATAKEIGVDRVTLSNHLHGHSDHIKNVRYAIDGIGTTS